MQRKTVTVLFCDIAGSTALGESVDPEALRAVLARYFERMKSIVESHGGTVEKFIGDAVMAVFGVPVVHEDDAVRAVRAASEMRAALPELGVQARIGVNTGEVVTGTEERLATGDAVNVAARLQQAAAPGEVLLGVKTLRLVRESVETEPVEPLELKGKDKPVSAYRLLAVHAAVERRPAVPMIGRETELRRLADTYAQAERDRACQLFTVLGTAGVGKSRLADEFLDTLAEARVVRSRCLSYGKGITYWPVVEVVKQLGAHRAADVAAPIRSLLGQTDAGTSAEEIAWAFRKLLEDAAQERPVVWRLDNLQWGEDTFLDLVEHVADLSRDAPVLLLCMARPELLDRRSGWGGGKWNATTVLLEPLDAAETQELLDALGAVEDELRVRITDAAEGNPLFVEEMIALVRESEDDDVVVPPTIQALLAARLDQLEPAERSVLERGAVEGRIFHQSAVQELLDGEPQLPARLLALVRKELVRPERAQLRGDDAFRFRHLLIRDAAYDALPKATRAELHERFAMWLENRGADLVELDEILGHHLEQAARYKQELGEPDAALAERASERLAAAGRRALWRGDLRAAAGLLERALELLRPTRLDVALELDLAAALAERGDSRDAVAVAEAAAERARAANDVGGEAVARVAAVTHGLDIAVIPALDELDALARAALALLERTDDHAGLVHVWIAFGAIANFRGSMEGWAQAAERALHHSRLAGQHVSHRFGLEAALVTGPRPADEALQLLDAFGPGAHHPGLLVFRGALLAMLGRFDEAWASAIEGHEQARELSGEGDGMEWLLAEIATLAGDHEGAARFRRTHYDFLREKGGRAFLATYAPLFGRTLCMLGRYDEAEPLAHLGRELGNEQDIATQAFWRQTQALVDAASGRHAAAEALAREAVATIEQTDQLYSQGNAFCDLAEVLLAAGRTEEAAAALAEAIERYERKKNLASAAQVRARLDSLTLTA